VWRVVKPELLPVPILHTFALKQNYAIKAISSACHKISFHLRTIHFWTVTIK